MKAYEVEVHFIGAPDYYYFTDKTEAEKAAKELNELPAERAYFGIVETRAYITEFDLADNQYIEGNEIITSNRRYTA